MASSFIFLTILYFPKKRKKIFFQDKFPTEKFSLKKLPSKFLFHALSSNMAELNFSFSSFKETFVFPKTSWPLKTNIFFSREKYPDAEILVHPECDPEIQKFADYVLSTGGMISHVKESPKKTFIIGTEVDLVTRLRRENPDKTILPALSEAICKTMKLHTLEKIKNSLLNQEFVVTVDKEIADKARGAVERMIEVSKR